MPQRLPRVQRARKARSALKPELAICGVLTCVLMNLPWQKARAEDTLHTPTGLTACGKLRPAGPRCLQLRGAPHVADGKLRVPISYLDSATGQPLPQQEYTLLADPSAGQPPLKATVYPQAVDLVLVVERYQQRLVEPSNHRAGSTLRLLKDSLGELVATVQKIPGSRVRMLHYGFDVLPLPTDAAAGSKDVDTALRTLDYQAHGGSSSSYVLNDALALGVGGLVRAAAAGRPRPVLLVVSDGKVANQLINAPLYQLLGYTAVQSGITVDIVGFAGLDEVQDGFYALAQQTAGVVRQPTSDQLPEALRALSLELAQQFILEFSIADLRSASPPRDLRIETAAGDRLAIPTLTPWPAPPALVKSPLPAVVEVPAGERSASALDILLTLSLSALGLLLLGGAMFVSHRVMQLRRGLRDPQRADRLKRETAVAWVVPLSGPTMFRTMALGPEGLSIGNDATCECYVPELSQSGLRFHIQRHAGRVYKIHCPPGSAITVAGERQEGTLTVHDGMQFGIGSVLFAFKRCLLDPDSAPSLSTNHVDGSAQYAAAVRAVGVTALALLISGCGTAVVSADLVSRRLPYPIAGYEQAEELGGGLPAQRVYSIIHTSHDAGRPHAVSCSIDVDPGIALLGFGPVPSRECGIAPPTEVPCEYRKLSPGQEFTCMLTGAGEYAVTVSRGPERWGIIRYNIRCAKTATPDPPTVAASSPVSEAPAVTTSPPAMTRRNLVAAIELSSFAQQEGRPFWELLLDSCHGLSAGESGKVPGRGAAVTFAVTRSVPCKVRVFGLAAEQPLHGRIVLQPY